MKGKIIYQGLISGEDGGRYAFTLDDVINLENDTFDTLTGLEVDFVAGGGDLKDKATQIVVFKPKPSAIKSTFSLSSAPSVESIKKLVYTSFGLTIFAYISLILTFFLDRKELFAFGGISFLIAKFLAFGLMIKALLDIKKLCGQSVLAWFLIYTLCLAAAAFLVSFAAKSGLRDMEAFPLIAGVLLFISWIAMSFYYDILSNISGEKSFMAVFWLNSLGILAGLVAAVMMDGKEAIFIAQTIAIILSLIAFFVELYAWVQVRKFKKIEKLNSIWR